MKEPVTRVPVVFSRTAVKPVVVTAGATTTVTPGTFFSKRLNRCGLEMKLAGRLGLRLLEILGSDGADSTIFMGLFSAEKELKFN